MEQKQQNNRIGFRVPVLKEYKKSQQYLRENETFTLKYTSETGDTGRCRQEDASHGAPG